MFLSSLNNVAQKTRPRYVPLAATLGYPSSPPPSSPTSLSFETSYSSLDVRDSATGHGGTRPDSEQRQGQGCARYGGALNQLNDHSRRQSQAEVNAGIGERRVEERGSPAKMERSADSGTDAEDGRLKSVCTDTVIN